MNTDLLCNLTVSGIVPGSLNHLYEGSKLCKEMRKVAENISRENPEIVFSIVERGGISVERMLMNTNPTESKE